MANKTVGDLMEEIYACKTTEEAAAFMETYRTENPEHADSNIGYLIGYMNDFDRGVYYERFGVIHPIFGGSV